MMKISFWILLSMLFVSSCFAVNVTDALSEADSSSSHQSDASKAHQPQTGSAQAAQAVLASDEMAHKLRMLQENNKVPEVIALCLLAFVSLVAVLFFLTRKPDANTGTNIVHATGLIFIVIGTIALVIMAQTEQQLTAAVGILGAIAGYLFGSMKHKEPDNGKTDAWKTPVKQEG